MKAQVSAEFLVVFSALVTIFLVFFMVGMGHNVNLAQISDSVSGDTDAYALSVALNYVHLAGDGAQYNFTSSRNLSISDVSVESERGQAPLLNSDTNATNVSAGAMLIKNNDGGLEIEQ